MPREEVFPNRIGRGTLILGLALLLGISGAAAPLGGGPSPRDHDGPSTSAGFRLGAGSLAQASSWALGHFPTTTVASGYRVVFSNGSGTFNLGLTLDLTAFRLALEAPSVPAAFEIAASDPLGTEDVVIGLFASSNLTGGASIPFWALVSASTDGLIAGGYSPSAPPSDTPLVIVANETQGDRWEFLLNGVPFPGSSEPVLGRNRSEPGVSPWVAIASIGSSVGPVLPDPITLEPSLIQVRSSSGWNLPGPAVGLWNGTQTPVWGIAGSRQNASLVPGAVEWAPSLPVLPNGTVLWTGSAPSPVNVSLALSPLTVQGGSPVAYQIRVSRGGQGIAGARDWLASSLEGGFLEGSGVTNATGGIAGTFSTSNVPNPVNDTFTVIVMGTAIWGWDSASVTLDPSTVAVSVMVLLSRTQAPPRTPVPLEVRLVRGGEPVPGVPLTAQASVGGGGFTYPEVPWKTNPEGFAYANYTTPPTTGPVTLTVTPLNGSGVSGYGQASLTVGSVPHSSPIIGGAVVLGVLVVILLAAVLVLLRRSRRRQGGDRGGRSLRAKGGILKRRRGTNPPN
jgi:hypothetical protein